MGLVLLTFCSKNQNSHTCKKILTAKRLQKMLPTSLHYLNPLQQAKKTVEFGLLLHK